MCVGVPPFVHGSLDEGLDLELPLIRAGIHLFVEKPVSVQPPEKFRAYVAAVMSEQKKHNVVVGVGYMFRYHPAVDKIKEVSPKHLVWSPDEAFLSDLHLFTANDYSFSRNPFFDTLHTLHTFDTLYMCVRSVAGKQYMHGVFTLFVAFANYERHNAM